MTVDERLQFLLQSTESLHSTVQEISGQISEHGRLVAENARQIAEHSKQLAQDGEHIRALVRIAELHHQRLERLETDRPA